LGTAEEEALVEEAKDAEEAEEAEEATAVTAVTAVRVVRAGTELKAISSYPLTYAPNNEV